MHLLHLGFICSKTDPSLFTFQTHKGKFFLYVLCGVYYCNRKYSSHVLEVVLQLGMNFSMKDVGPLHFLLGIEVDYFEGGIHLIQSEYGAEMLAKTEMTFAKAVATPLARKHGLYEAVGCFVYTSF